MSGVIIGLFASYCLTRFLASQIWSIAVTDPWTFGAVALLAIFIGLIACLLPAFEQLVNCAVPLDGQPGARGLELKFLTNL
jgi:hypothetical protein